MSFMKISCVQMNMEFCAPDENFRHAKDLIREAAKSCPDIILLPEMWNTGFFPKEKLMELSDKDGERARREIGALAKELSVNIVAGSIADVRCGKIYNTAYVFDRSGNCVCQYDKTHLFSPMGEDKFFEKGAMLNRFRLDGKECGIIICYDLRFPEASRSLAVQGIDFLFVVSQWPDVRIRHLTALAKARAIENQIFVAVCNSCGRAADTKYGGNSAIFNPWGESLTTAGTEEEIITAKCDMQTLRDIRKSINVFCDRRTDIYNLF